MATYTYTTTPVEDVLIASALTNINARRATAGDKAITANDLIVIGCQRLLGQFAIDKTEADKKTVADAFATVDSTKQAAVKTILNL